MAIIENTPTVIEIKFKRLQTKGGSYIPPMLKLFIHLSFAESNRLLEIAKIIQQIRKTSIIMLLNL